MDWCVGEMTHTLRELGVSENTIVIFSSDNGPEWTSTRKDVVDDATVGARGYDTYYSVGSTGGLRGKKRSLR